MQKGEVLPPVIPKPTAGGGWDIVSHSFLQLTTKIELRAAGRPVDPVLLEHGCCV